jgi:hypothetical protein
MVAPALGWGNVSMSCSSTAAKSPMAEYLKSPSPQALWKASLKPQDPFKPDDPWKAGDAADPAGKAGPIQAAKLPGTGLTVDVTA